MRLHTYEELAGRLAPELADRIYVVRQPPAAGCFGWAERRGIHFGIRRELIALNRWDGPRPMIGLCGDFGRYDDIGHLIHEIGHLLPYKPILADDIDPTDEQIRRQSKAAALFVSQPDPEVPGVPPWLPDHGADYIRRCVHLHHRARVLGFDVPYPCVVDGATYGIPALIQFARRLGDEPERFSGASFDDIEAQEPPAAYSALWRDVFTSWERYDRRKQTQTERNVV